MRTIGADCSRVASVTTPGPPPQPHGWVRLGLEVLRFPHFWGEGSGHVPRFLRHFKVTKWHELKPKRLC